MYSCWTLVDKANIGAVLRCNGEEYMAITKSDNREEISEMLEKAYSTKMSPHNPIHRPLLSCETCRLKEGCKGKEQCLVKKCIPLIFNGFI